MLYYTECNFAAVGAHYYPIGACETYVNATSGEMESFKYVCNDDDEIEMQLYDTFDCYGDTNRTRDASELDLLAFQCKSEYGDCSHSIGCSFSDCGDDSGCDSCSGLSIESLIQNHNTHCFPYITNQCYGVDEVRRSSTCSNGELTEGYYFGATCSVDNFGYNYEFGGASACKDDNDDGVYTYYKIDCEPAIVEPQCNYVATGLHVYPINACESEVIIINDTDTEEYSFRYVCTDDGDIMKYTYSQIDCEGDPTMTTPTDIEHHQCKASRDCNYAIGCAYKECSTNVNDTTCSICSETNYINNNRKDHNFHCLPVITDGCFGLKDELLHSSTCSNGVLTEGFYWGRECNSETYSFGDQRGGVNSTCVANYKNEYTYYEVECVIAPTSFPTQAPTPTPTQAPTETADLAATTSIFIAMIYANIFLLI